MTVTLYHNPRCNKSREALALIRQAGIEPVVVEYLKDPPGKTEWLELVRRMGVTLRSLLRQTEKPYDELGLSDLGLSDDALLEAVARHPILMNRPIVATPNGVRLCRPPEAVLELLGPPSAG